MRQNFWQGVRIQWGRILGKRQHVSPRGERRRNRFFSRLTRSMGEGRVFGSWTDTLSAIDNMPEGAGGIWCIDLQIKATAMHPQYGGTVI